MNPTTIRQSNFEQLQSRLADARAQCGELFDIVRPEALYDRPIAERHRIIFYLGHLEAFDWNLLREPLALESFDPAFDKLFAFGIDPVGGGLPDDQPGDWPTVDAIRAYNARLRSAIDEKLAETASQDPYLGFVEHGRLLEIAIEHRLMHAETLAYMLHQLPLERKFAMTSAPAPAASARESRMVKIPAGVATLGLPHDSEIFGWDNEFDQHQVQVPAFAMDVYNVTNGEFLRFVQAGSYHDRRLWSDAAWGWMRGDEHAQPHEHPLFWLRRPDGWSYRGMFEEIPMPLDAPVYVSHDEASAYARWAGKELPSEEQWHRAACGTRSGSERAYPWGEDVPNSLRHGNFDMRYWDPVPVGSFPQGFSDFGVADLIGNGWEWTRTPFAPFSGFAPFASYPGYSANFFDGKHFVMKGGSPRTAACMLRRSFRNWFQPHYPYVYATFRCVEHT